MAKTSDDYYRVFKALHLVTHEAVPCVDNCLKVWHQQQALPPCTRQSGAQCPDGKKPKAPASCQECVAWANAVEALLYHPTTNPLSAKPQMTWQNVNSSNLGRSHVEVAKAFVLRLPKKQASAGASSQQYTSVSEFDSASLLMIMARFAEFHQGDRASYEIIMKVSGIRNDLSHMGLEDNMQLDNLKVKHYFRDIEDFVTCLENLHPQQFASGQDVKAKLKEIQLEPITSKMKEEVHIQMQEDLDSVRHVTEGIHQTTTELKEQLGSMKEVVDELIIERDDFIRCWNTLHYAVTKSIPCLRRALQRWQEDKRKILKPCQRPRPRPAVDPEECSEQGKPTSSSSCSSCVAWGKTVEDAYYPQKSKGNIPWDNINPTCLVGSHSMVAKAFVSRSQSAMKCTKLEDLDLGSILDIMMRFKEFLGGERSTFDTVGKISGIRSMLSQMREERNFHLKDQQVEDIFNDVDSFVSCLETIHPQWFTSTDADDSRTTIKQIQRKPITRKMKQEVDIQMSRELGSTTQTCEIKEQMRRIEDKIDKVVTQNEVQSAIMGATQNSPEQYQQFIACCTSLLHIVNKFIPCLGKVWQRWHQANRKRIGPCQRAGSASNKECSERGKPTSTLSCASCVAWGKAVEDAYYPQKSKGNIPWDDINPTCLAGSHFIIAKAFVSRSQSAMKCTKLEDLDLGSLLDIMMRFKDFVGGEKSTFDMLKKVSDDISMLRQMREECKFSLKDQQVQDIFNGIDSFVSRLLTLHPQCFTPKDAENIRKSIEKIRTSPLSEWVTEGLPMIYTVMKAFTDPNTDAQHSIARRLGITSQEHDDTLKKCQKELRRYYLDSLCKIPLFPGDNDSCVNLKDIYTKLSFEIILPSPCNPVKMPLTSYSEMFTRKSIEGRHYTKFLMSAPAGLGKTTLTAKIAYDWATKEDKVLKDIDLLFVINMRSVKGDSNLEDVILSQMFPKDSTITTDEIKSLIQRHSASTIIVLDAVDESDRKLYHPSNRGNIVEFLTGEILLSCKLLATTRPWRISEISQRCKSFARVEISGFNKDDIREYIRKFFSDDNNLGDSLIRHANQNRLIDDIAYIPLMSLLICVYWREVQQESIPHRISQLYDAIINIMHDHYLKKRGSTAQLPTNDDEIQALLNRMGKMALEGFWPPENRVVFSPSEMSSSEDVESACQIGFLSRQQLPPSIIKRSSRNQTTLTFFHKTCGEKCAGEYLAHLAEDNPQELMSKLSQLKTVQDALSVRLILQFACGSSNKAAYKWIMRWLMRIFHIDKSVGPQQMEMHVDEKLELAETLTIQNFMDLCLRCNYEADSKDEFYHLLSDFFPGKNICIDNNKHTVISYRQILYLGISAFTTVALSYYLSSSQSQFYWSITLRPAAHPCDMYTVHYGPLVNISAKARREVNHISLDAIRNICQEYTDKHPEMHTMNKMSVIWSPSSLLCNIRMWQACEELPTAGESDIDPIFDSTTTKKVHLAVLDLTSFNVPKRNVDRLLEIIGGKHLLHLVFLKVALINMTESQMLCLARDLKKMPDLVELDVTRNESNGFLSMLAESMSSMKSLQRLHLGYVATSTSDMAQFVHKFRSFASQLRELILTSTIGVMKDGIASQLADHISIAKNLEKFWIDFHDFCICRSTQNKLLSELCHLSQLFEIQVFFLKYPDDVMRTMAQVMKSLPKLTVLALSTGEMMKHSIGTATWQEFKATLLQMRVAVNIFDLRLLHIGFKKDDFAELLSVCREKRYRTLMYSTVCLPAGFVVPDDEFLALC